MSSSLTLARPRPQMRRSGQGRRRDEQVHVPPPISPTVRVSKKWRFAYSNPSVNMPDFKVSARDLDLLAVASAANSGYGIASSARVKSLEIWALNPTGAVVSASIDYTTAGSSTSVGGPSVTHTGTTIGTANVCHVKSKVPPESQASLWNPTLDNIEAMFEIRAPSPQVILDVSLEFAIHDSASDGPNPVS